MYFGFAKTISMGAAISAIVVASACLVSASGSSYQQSVEKWRHDYEKYLKADDGWLTVSGLFVIASPSASRTRTANSSGISQDCNGFPLNETYLFTARYVPYDSPKQIETQNILGDMEKVSIVGYVSFSLRGQEYRLDAEGLESGGLFIVFRDLTSAKETYGAARFLAAEAPNGGRVLIDFNKAYNPPCAYNPYTTCPLPLPGNRLRVGIPAGEKMYKREH